MKKEIESLLDGAFGETHTLNTLGGIAHATVEGIEYAGLANDEGLKLAFAGVGSAAKGAGDALIKHPEGEREVRHEAMRDVVKSHKDDYEALCSAATPAERAAAYASVTTLITLAEAAKHILQKVLVEKEEIYPLAAIEVMTEQADKRRAARQLPPDEATLNDAFAEAFGLGGSGDED